MKFGEAIENCNLTMGRKESIIAKTTLDQLRSGGGAALLVAIIWAYCEEVGMLLTPFDDVKIFYCVSCVAKHIV